ncbi:MAG: type I polyketide synthase, partial [Roseimicrobium sp.]
MSSDLMPDAGSDDDLNTLRPEPVAIVGIGCRFPGGASDPASFWRMLCDGVDAVREVPADRWSVNTFYDAEPGKPGRSISKWGGFVEGMDQFDPAFFGISPREAAFMDPQQRLLLEAAWDAIEDGGQDIGQHGGANVGVFVGISTQDYARLQSSCNDLNGLELHSSTGSAASIAANRISYCLNLHGPSVSVDTACSSSLVAVHLACRALRNGECQMALAAGVNVILTPDTFVGFSRMGMLSPEGRCKAFDATGKGFVRGEGVGVVALKPLSAALAAGDAIYAVILGSAVNQDGHTNGMTVPSPQAQEAVVRAACEDAGISPSEVQYIEAHGTGTPVGDPLEAHALGQAVGKARSEASPLVIGSVKTNLGHLESAAGIASIIKLALALKHATLPASLHFKE